MTTLKVFDVDGTRGLAAIYTIDSANPDNDAPLVNPYANLAAVQWHSQFRYPRVIIDQQATVNVPSGVANKPTMTTFDLFAHGRPGGVPMLGPCALLVPITPTTMGWTPLSATTPISHVVTVGSTPTVRIYQSLVLSVGVNATHVRLQACRQGVGDAFAATVRITVLDQYL